MKSFTLRMQRREDQRGLTLVELMISVVLLTLVTGTLSAAFVNAINIGEPTAQKVREANDAQVIAGLLTTDAQATGGTDPQTAEADPTLGVSFGDDGGCPAPDGNLVVRFKWNDHAPGPNGASVPTLHIANYALNDATAVLTRTSCVGGGAPQTLQLGSSIAGIDPSCDPVACPPLPRTVTLELTATNAPPSGAEAYKYRLTAAVRPQGQIAPTGPKEGTRVPFLVMGGACMGEGDADPYRASGIRLSVGAELHVRGDVVINDNGAACAAAMTTKDARAYSAGATSILNPGGCIGDVCPTRPGPGTFDTKFPDPYAQRTWPGSEQCQSATSTPVDFDPNVTVYRGPLRIASDAQFRTGATYVLCRGARITGGAVTGTDVTLYAPRGQFAVANPASFAVSGLLYAPTSLVEIRGTTATIDNVVAGRFHGNGGANMTVGAPPPAGELRITQPLPCDSPPVQPCGMPNWTVGKPYPTQTFAAAGGSEVYRWSAINLPPGLTFDPFTGILEGTPDTPGAFNVEVTVRDTYGEVVTGIYSVTINPPPTIFGPDSLPDWTVNRDYPGIAITAQNGTTPYTWEATGLPRGFALDPSTGVITGTPTEVKTTSGITVTVTDATGTPATRRDFSIKINPPPEITGPATLTEEWTSGQTYPEATMTAEAGTEPYTWSASGLPRGITINPTSGRISGTPADPGEFAVTVTLRDVAGATWTKAYDVLINPRPGIFDDTVPTAEINRPYNHRLTATGGSSPYTWGITPPAPPGISIIPTQPNDGTLYGTPTATGTYDMTVTIRDRIGATRSKQFTFVVAPAPTINGPDALVEWTRGRDYPGTQVTATGGITPYLWSSPDLPPGLSIDRDTGVISGAPNWDGTRNVTINLVDAAGGTASRTYTLIIHPVPQVTTDALPTGEVTVPYNTNATATAGTPPYFWAASGLPQGLTIDEDSGVISGTPTAAGTFQVTLTAVDAAGAAASRNISLTIDREPSFGGPADLNDWTVDMPYAPVRIQPAGGLAPFTFNAPDLPPGMFIDQNTGDVGGTPTATGDYTTTISITDARAATTQRLYDLTIYPPPTINGPANMPDGALGGDYPEATFTATGGTPPRSFDATGLPAGLEIDGGSGIVSGTPTEAGTFPVDVSVTDATGANATMRSTITINPPPTLLTVTPPVALRLPLQVALLGGTNFADNATVAFVGPNAPTVTSAVFETPVLITLTFDASAAAPGTYDIVVTNPDGGTSTLASAVAVT